MGITEGQRVQPEMEQPMNKLEQAAREVVRQHSMECLSDKAITALREALAEQAEQEPVVKIHKYNEFQTLGSLNLPIGTKLYAAPVRTKDLTDDEIAEIFSKYASDLYKARAVIAADREKNKCQH